MTDQRDPGDENDHGRLMSVEWWQDHMFKWATSERKTGLRWLILCIPGPPLKPRVVEPDAVYEQVTFDTVLMDPDCLTDRNLYVAPVSGRYDVRKVLA